MAYGLRVDTPDLMILSFDYGQRHRKELEYANRCAVALDVPQHVIDLTHLTHLLGGSSLTSPEIPVPDGHYAEETMKITVVPNRNAIMLAIAYGVAVSHGARYVATAVHAGDHFIYPDCRPEFLDAFSRMEQLATLGFADPPIRLQAPFQWQTKADIVKAGEAWGVPWRDTWSCYKGGAIHCGTCGTCVERKEAFKLAGVDDPTEYLVKE